MNETAVGENVQLESKPTNKRRRLAVSVLLASLAIHAGAALIAGAWIIVQHMVVQQPEMPVLKAEPALKKTDREREREQSMQAAAFEGAAAQALFSDRIQSTRPTPISLPQLPKLSAGQPILSDSAGLAATAFAEAAALGAGASIGTGGSGAGGMGTGVSFLGVRTNAKRVVLMYDVSRTVATAAAKTGMPMERIREETSKLIDALGANTRFGMVEFARNYAFFRNELLPSTAANRAAAQAWLNTYFATDGAIPHGVPNLVSGSPGFLVALEAVFKLQPDSVFIISDGSMQRGTGAATTISLSEIEQRLAQLQTTLPQRAKVFFVGVGTRPEMEQAIRQILANQGGGGGYSCLKP